MWSLNTGATKLLGAGSYEYVGGAFVAKWVHEYNNCCI